jgi:hypothetical protein
LAFIPGGMVWFWILNCPIVNLSNGIFGQVVFFRIGHNFDDYFIFTGLALARPFLIEFSWIMAIRTRTKFDKRTVYLEGIFEFQD